jgi:hypothetical protein
VKKKKESTFSKEEIEKIVELDKKKYIILVVWEILNMIAVVYIQYFLRAQKIAYSATEKFLLGTLPSLFGAAAFVAIIFVFHTIYSKLLGRYKLLNSITFAFSVTFFGFLLWEIIRMGIYPFDLYDIVMTFVGCVLSSVIILTLFFKDIK